MKVLIILLLINFSVNTYAADLHNTLKQHASPYLAMHGSDPVSWQEWNSETVNKAKKRRKTDLCFQRVFFLPLVSCYAT